MRWNKLILTFLLLSPLHDALQAMRILRDSAAVWHTPDAAVGVMGFSRQFPDSDRIDQAILSFVIGCSN